MTLPATEFLRRFLLHVLPRGFVRIRRYGFLSNRHRKTAIPKCRELVQTWLTETETLPSIDCAKPDADEAKPSTTRLCPACGASMQVIETIRRPRNRSP